MESSIELLAKSDPKSLVNLLPTAIANKLDELAFERPELFSMDDDELEKLAKPAITLERLRISFWHEYHRAQEQGRKMTSAGIYAGVCLQQYFSMTVMQKPLAFAWLLRPPASYAIAMEEALVQAIKRVREVLNMPLNGSAKNAAIFLKAMEMLDARLNGAAVQRIESKSVSVQINKSDKALPSPSEIEAKIRALEIQTGTRVELDTDIHSKTMVEVLNEPS